MTQNIGGQQQIVPFYVRRPERNCPLMKRPAVLFLRVESKITEWCKRQSLPHTLSAYQVWDAWSATLQL